MCNVQTVHHSNTKVTITDAQFARDYVLPATKDKADVALRFLPHEYTRPSWWALQIVVPLCAITLPIAAFMHHLYPVLNRRLG